MKKIYRINQLLESVNENLKDDLKFFIRYSFGHLRPGEEYFDNWHIDAIAEYLKACKNREIKRLIINMPPRSMKSLTTSVAFPAWLMGNDPTTSVVCASYSQSLSNQHSLDCRAVMESDWFKSAFPECRFTRDQNQKSEYMTTQYGKRIATSVGSTMTGKGGSCFPKGTIITTDKGNTPIEEIVTNPCKYKVLSYNHSLGVEEYKNVIATRTLRKRGLYEIRTAKGDSVKCTGDHPIYIERSGYIRADKVNIGQLVYKCGTSNSQQAEDNNLSFLYVLLKGIYNSIIPIQKDVKERIGGQLLFTGLLSESPRCKKLPQLLQKLWCKAYRQKEELLQRSMSSNNKRWSKENYLQSMSVLFSRVCEKAFSAYLLYPRLCQQSASSSDVKRKQFQLPSWNGISKIFPQIESDNQRKRWLCLSNLWYSRMVNSTSRGSQQAEQRGREFDYDVPSLSYKASQEKSDSISSVTRISETEHVVYDIQVEGNHNFFAEGILVHNCIIIDDPLNPSQAASDAERDTANNWMSSTVPSRLNNQANDVIIVNMQRLHEDDVTGHLLEKGGWEHLCLPAVNDRRRVISLGNFKKVFEDGELLHPERLPKKVLTSLEHDLGSFDYAGQYLQAPVPKGGGILRAEWWNEWPTKALPSCEYIIQVYDTAFKTGSMNDFTARTTWGIFRHSNEKPNIILLDALNKRLTLPELREEATESYYDFDPDVVLIEDKASGISLIQELRRIGLRLKSLGRGRGDDKISRAHIASVMLEQGVVWYPKGCAWANEVIRQCASFPNAKYDDLVDTVSDALIFLRHYKRVEVISDNAASSGSTSFKPHYGGHYG